VLPVLQAVAAALLFGLSAPLAKLLLGTVSPWLLAALLYLGAGAFLTAVRLGRTGRPALGTALRGSDRWWLAGLVLCGGVLAPPLLLWGLARAPAASVALLLNTEVIFTALLAAVLFREHVGARVLAATGLVALGGMTLEWGWNGLALSPAVLAVLAACALWGLDNNLTRRLAEADPFALVQVKGLAAGSTNLVLAGLLGSPPPRLAAAALGLGLGALSYGASLVLFVLALRGLGAARTGAYFALGPFFGAAGAVLVLGEPLTPRLGVAGVLMAAAAWLLAREAHEHGHEHGPGVHAHRHVHDAHHQHAHEGWEGAEPHIHPHPTGPLAHAHPHRPDLHHGHEHDTHPPANSGGCG
jgi:drug/metabolite transporter (DMT)-like permease